MARRTPATRDGDAVHTEITYGTIPGGSGPGMSPGTYFDLLRVASDRCCGALDYELVPVGGYNSNGFVTGIIEATSGTPIGVPLSRFPGAGRPIPPDAFLP
jgi:hypothetical protein